MQEDNQTQSAAESDKQDRDKRKRSETSSTSELETSTTDATKKSGKSKKKAKKMSKTNEPTIDEYFSSAKEDKQMKTEMKEIRLQLKEVNAKLTSMINKVERSDKKMENVVNKDDGSLRTLFRELMVEMKQELLNSVVNRIEMLESRIFDKDAKNDELNKEVTSLQNEVVDHKTKHEALRNRIDSSNEKMTRLHNDMEQYSRANNIRIHGIVSTDAFETADQTTDTVIKTLNEKMKLKLRKEDVDIAHRLRKVVGGNQEVIVKLQSRLVKETILNNRKLLKDTGIYINEDLTKMNQEVLMSVKKKRPDTVNNAFSRNGVIKYFTKTGELKTGCTKTIRNGWISRGLCVRYRIREQHHSDKQ